MKSILIVDFYDSFTFNIVSEFFEVGVKCKVIGHDDPNLESEISNFKNILFGPGPGNVYDYKNIEPILKKVLLNKEKYKIGICLGHQLILSYLGFSLTLSKKPIHGSKVEIQIPSWLGSIALSEKTISVQRYNSWAVKPPLENLPKPLQFYVNNDEILISKGKDLVTFQFHPESVGTENKNIFFQFLKGKLK